MENAESGSQLRDKFHRVVRILRAEYEFLQFGQNRFRIYAHKVVYPESSELGESGSIQDHPRQLGPFVSGAI